MIENLNLEIREASSDDIDTLIEFRRLLQDSMTDCNPNLFGLAVGWEGKKREQYAGSIDDPRKHLILACICSAPGSLDTSLSHAAGLIEIAACHA